MTKTHHSQTIPKIDFRSFASGDQKEARSLILAGLKEHFGTLESSFNHDLDDIWNNYIAAGDRFLVVYAGGELVGTGALIKESIATGRIVRMSVARHMRRKGIGRKLARELIRLGKESGFRRIVVETNDDWHDAIRLYERCGFVPYNYRNGEIHMVYDLVTYETAQ